MKLFTLVALFALVAGAFASLSDQIQAVGGWIAGLVAVPTLGIAGK